ncbi:MAG: type II toxin-antitoxin system PemK/MazF family toxin [Candidatus Moeniiplasma glomeromycotorum]|nr:type II toxin-antitoxin system PemK/MazF family toxin [Candidatus Moeniiplasma glomeromycotorum]MCE8168617.1 type II toxin-antitoxin system PemK/MazF family toxin [Candidatus Moeniiplasma glomeromycotorum]
MKLPDKGGYELKENHLGVVISNNRQNLTSPLIIMLPITSRKVGDKIYHFEVETFINNQPGKILVDQITTTDKMKRVRKLMGKVDERIMIKIERAICYVLALSTEALTEELAARRKKIFG